MVYSYTPHVYPCFFHVCAVKLATQHRLQCLSHGVERGWDSVVDHTNSVLQHVSSALTSLQHANTSAPTAETLTQEIDLLSLLPMTCLTAVTVEGSVTRVNASLLASLLPQ